MEDYSNGPEGYFEPDEQESLPLLRRWGAKLTTIWQAWRQRWSEISPKLKFWQRWRRPRPEPTAMEAEILLPDVERPLLEEKPKRRWLLGRRKLTPEEEEEISRWIALLGYPDDPAHPRALDELVVIGRPAIPALVEALRSDTWIQVYRASEALGLIGHRRATYPLLRLLNHPNSNVRWGAAESLGRIRSRWARGRLRRVANEDESRTSWGETVAEAAERAVASIDQTFFSRLINVMQVLLLLAACAVIVLMAFEFIRQEFEQRSQRTPTPTVTLTPTATITPSPTATPSPPFEPLAATISGESANVRDRPDATTSTIIGVLHFSDEVVIYGGRSDEAGGWWYLARLIEIHNPATSSEVLEGGVYGWVHSSLVTGVESPDIAPTVEAIETMRAAVATPTTLGSSLDLPTPLPTTSPTTSPTPTPSE